MMTEWDGGYGYRSFNEFEKQKMKMTEEKALRAALLASEKEQADTTASVITDTQRQLIVERALEKLSQQPDSMPRDVAREHMIATIAETRAALGDRVNLEQIAKLVDDVEREVHADATNHERAQRQAQNDELLRSKKAQEEREAKQIQQANRVPWYWWVVGAILVLPLMVPVLRVIAVVLGRSARVVF